MKITNNFDQFFQAANEAAVETLERTGKNIETHAKSIAAVKTGVLQKGIDHYVFASDDKMALWVYTDTSSVFTDNKGNTFKTTSLVEPYGWIVERQKPNLGKKPNPGLNPNAEQFFMQKSLQKEVGDGSLLVDTFEDELNKRW